MNFCDVEQQVQTSAFARTTCWGPERGKKMPSEVSSAFKRALEQPQSHNFSFCQNLCEFFRKNWKAFFHQTLPFFSGGCALREKIDAAPMQCDQKSKKPFLRTAVSWISRRRPPELPCEIDSPHPKTFEKCHSGEEFHTLQRFAVWLGGRLGHVGLVDGALERQNSF